MALITKITYQLRRALCATAFIPLSLSISAYASELNKPTQFNIPAQSLDVALVSFSEQANIQIVVQADNVKNLETKGVTGNHNAESALQLLLSGSGLIYKMVGDDTIAVSKAKEDASSGNGGPASNKTLLSEDGASVENSGRKRSSLMEEVTVTAQKREQNLQDVSLAITAFSGETIKNLGFQSSVDIVAQAPNTFFRPTGPTAIFSIRGINLLDFGDANEPPIGFYRDEVYRGTVAGQASQIFDLERVEVLRGPQGTLFGRNTTGGLVHFFTARPTEEFEGYAEIQYGSHNQKILEFAVSGPLSERVRGRFSMKYNKDDGWQENQFNGADFAATDVISGRAQLEIDLNEDANLLLRFEGTEQENTHQGYGHFGLQDPSTFAPCSQGMVRSSQCIDFSGLLGFGPPGSFNDPSPNPDEIFSEESDLPSNIDLYSTSATLTWKFEHFDLTSITAYETVEKELEEDVDGGPFYPLTFLYEIDASQISQELRLSGETEHIRWVVGGFYFDDEKEDGFISIPGVIPLFGTTLGFQNEYEQETTAWALFTQTEWDLSEQVTLIGGLRYSDEEKDLFITDSLTAGNFQDKEELSTENLTGKIGLEWRPNDDVMAYASISTGFKSGAFNTSLVASGEAAPVGEEEITSYEVGIKTTLWDGRLRLNASAFYYDYEDVQSVAATATPGGGFPVTRFINAGDATVQGLEADMLFQPTDNLEMSLAVGVIDSEIDADSTVTIDGFQLDGNELPMTPSLSLNGLIRYHIPTDNSGTFTLQSDFRWQDDVKLRVDNDPLDTQKDYGVLNLRASWSSPSERYYATIFGENVTGEEYFEHAFSINTFGLQGVIWGKTEWYGVKFGMRF